jgi:hypothetical protein
MGPANQPIRLSIHAVQQMAERGATADEVADTIRTGAREAAKRGRTGFRKTYPYGKAWSNKSFANKQMLAIVVEEPTEIVVVTVYVFYF